jgi:hypothetical protein
MDDADEIEVFDYGIKIVIGAWMEVKCADGTISWPPPEGRWRCPCGEIKSTVKPGAVGGLILNVEADCIITHHSFNVLT